MENEVIYFGKNLAWVNICLKIHLQRLILKYSRKKKYILTPVTISLSMELMNWTE